MRRALVALAALALVSAAPADAGRRHHRARFTVVKRGRVAHVPAGAAARTPVAWGPLPAPFAPAVTTSPPSAPTVQPAPPACPTAVGVTEAEYYTTLSRATVCAGAVTVQLRNVGQDQHDLRLVREDGTADPIQYDTLTPGTTSTRTLSLAAGSYYLYCTLADGGGTHEAQGMHALLTVTG